MSEADPSQRPPPPGRAGGRREIADRLGAWFAGVLPQRRATESARLDNVYFRQLFENSPDGIVLLDRRDRVIDCNRAFENLFGYTAAEARGRPVNSLIVPQEQYEEATAMSMRALSREIVATERVRRRKDGQPVHVRILGYPIIENDRQIGIFGIYSDITMRRRAEERLRLQGAAMKSAANSIFITRRDGTIEWVNWAFTRLTGYPEREVLGRRPDFLDAGRGEGGFDAREWAEITPGEVWRGQVASRHKDGRLYTVEQSVTPIATLEGEVTHFVVVQEDITARVDAERRLRHLARHDFLTDLPNRYTLDERLEVELERAAEPGNRVAVMVLDLDHFKDVNDTYGHAVGDELLVAVAERLHNLLRRGAVLARLGGDEFAVLQTDFTELENADGLARRLTASFQAPFNVGAREIHISASIGIAVYPPGEPDPKQLLKKADLALYRAKEEGRSTCRFHTEDMDQQAQMRMRLGQDLYGAIGRDELHLVYQPQIERPSGRLLGIEALLRWRHADGAVGPDQFVPIAEGSGLILPIGEWVLRRACRDALEWQRGRAADLAVSVNVSPIQFKSPELAHRIAAILEEVGIEPQRVELELTEGVLIQPTEVVQQNLRRLEKLGVRFSLDDFGKGYSSLAYLHRLRLHKLKIDRSFVAGVEVDRNQALIVGAVTALGRKLGLQVIAEGVESKRQADILEAQACTGFQGYYFCRPAPIDELRETIAAGRLALGEG